MDTATFGRRGDDDLEIVGEETRELMADGNDPNTDPNAGGDAGGGDGSDEGSQSSEEPRTFSQDELDRIVGERLARERSKLGDVEELRRKAAEFDKVEEERKSELEKAVDKAAKEAEEKTRGELEPTWKKRLVRSEVRAVAAGKLADPNDAISLLDLDSFELDEDGNVDEDKVVKAITKLVEDKPYLAANGTRRKVDFDAGSRTPAKGGEDVNARIRRAAGIS